MARTVASLPAGSHITDYISLGVIAKFVPLEKVREVLAETNRASVRQRDLPAHVVVYYVIALALYRRSSDRDVLWGAWMSTYSTDEITLAQDVVPALRSGKQYSASGV
jgi:hypothetical protein